MKKIISYTACFSFFLLFLLHGPLCAEAARNGLFLWANTIVPVLFPCMVLSSFLVQAPFLTILTERGLSSAWQDRILFFLCLLFGMLCGIPIGAKLCADFRHSGQMDTKTANRLILCSTAPGPAFLTIYVRELFPSLSIPVLLISLYLPILIFSLWIFLSSFRMSPDHEFSSLTQVPAQPSTPAPVILGSVRSIVKIGWYLMFFSILVRLVSVALPANSAWIPLFSGILEITSGLSELSKTSFSPRALTLLVTGFCTFCGLSGAFQVRMVLSESDISFSLYLIGRVLHTLAALLICALLTST